MISQVAARIGMWWPDVSPALFVAAIEHCALSVQSMCQQVTCSPQCRSGLTAGVCGVAVVVVMAHCCCSLVLMAATVTAVSVKAFLKPTMYSFVASDILAAWTC
jgi:hypothetical protein